MRVSSRTRRRLTKRSRRTEKLSEHRLLVLEGDDAVSRARVGAASERFKAGGEGGEEVANESGDGGRDLLERLGVVEVGCEEWIGREGQLERET